MREGLPTHRMLRAGQLRSPAGSGGRTGRLTAIRAPAVASSRGGRRARAVTRWCDAADAAAMMRAMPETELETPHGLARVHLHAPSGDGTLRGALVLGHGAGGGVTAPDLQAATKAALDLGVTVALVEQPYRVAGRRSPAPAGQLDVAWTSVVDQLRAGPMAGLEVVAGGRSSGARVACRTAEATGAAGVLCLAFPVHPPGKPEKTRLPELDAVTVPALVVQGISDPFGMPPPKRGRRKVVRLEGDHGLRKELPKLREAVAAFLARVLST
jgi:uncharacterized protein